MFSVATAVNPNILERMLVWGAGLLEFEEHHAADGLFIAQAWYGSEAGRDNDDLFLMALMITFTFWVDDRSDKHIDAPNSGIDWQALFAVIDKRDPNGEAKTSEVDYFLRLSAALERRAVRKAEHDWWWGATARMLHGMHSEEQASRSGIAPSYAECLEDCAYSTGTEAILTAAYLTHELNRPGQYANPWLASMERYMCISQRVWNDLHSAEKERHEGKNGRVTNLVLLMEGVLPPRQARSFIEEQKRGYYQLADKCFERLGGDDPFVRLIRGMRDRIDQWYEHNPTRYPTVNEA